MVTFEDLYEAYLDCRVHKARTINCIKFMLDAEGNLLDLMNAINKREYKPKPSICFVVTRPKYREVFAADFSDRIIHHYIRLRLEPLMELEFNDRTFNCRNGKGTLAAVEQLKKDILECSEGYTKDCWVATVDIQSFFMSIPKKTVEDMVVNFIKEKYNGEDKEDLIYLAQVVLGHCPENNCIKQSADRMWGFLPPNKSLFTNGESLGMPIGNLPSQMFANFLLNELDWMIEDSCKIKCHGRYVDDIYLVSEHKNRILRAIPKIRMRLAKVGLTLSPKKFYMQHYSKGLDFTGAVVKPGRTYSLNRTVTSFKHSVLRLNKVKTFSALLRAIASVNSYLGLLKHYNSYAIRRNILALIEPRIYNWVYIRGMQVVVLKKKYHVRSRIKRQLAAGKPDPLLVPMPIADFPRTDSINRYETMMKDYKFKRLPSWKNLEIMMAK